MIAPVWVALFSGVVLGVPLGIYLATLCLRREDDAGLTTED